MALEIGFYPAEFHNTGDATGAVGGSINSSAVLSASLNAFFPEGVSDYIGQSDKYRWQKLWIKNTGSTAITNPKIFLNNVKHVGQIKIYNHALDTTQIINSSGTTATGVPTDVLATDLTEPIGISNAETLQGANPAPYSITTWPTNTSYGVWVRQAIGDNLPTETGASTTIGVIGEV